MIILQSDLDLTMQSNVNPKLCSSETKPATTLYWIGNTCVIETAPGFVVRPSDMG